ncbi:hypothetical protein U310_01701 [Staphylococcus aureus F89441]|nr:hypothetical protein T672_01801 [Staphylococcus aureus CHAP6049]EVU57875.1 hypothetical protein U147_00042 [Staphylococcus aureus W31852]EVY38785.1 hypothetical protein U310_01701 [Staphylococcus aureus F89441]EWB98023.1 hypothetical protein U252_02714 [Staphylococcus aureus F62013]EYP84639.1 hypothetical protein W238_01392 [Staphylococcus aureus DAR1800]CAC5984749.1 Uncharacterised protein [Staphylococcus aureus]
MYRIVTIFWDEVFSQWRFEIVVLWWAENAVLWRFQNGVSINKPQQDLDLTMTYTFHTYISDYFYSYK